MAQLTITKVMKTHAAEAAAWAREHYKIELDYSPASLAEVDRIISAVYFNRDRSLVSRLLKKNAQQELWNQAKMWGGYVGEVLRRKWGGQWHTTPLESGDVQISLKLLGSSSYPVDEVYKRLTDGPQGQSIMSLHEAVLTGANPAAMNLPDHAPPVVSKMPPILDEKRPKEGETGVIPVGIIGYGRIGAEHATWLSAAHGIHATVVYDVTPARRVLAEMRGLQTHNDIENLFTDPTIKAVLVTTPTAMHHEHAYRALAAGKHVMIEKPMTLNVSQARDLINKAKGSGLVLSVFHNRRWDVDYLTVKNAVEKGDFGRLINIESRIGQWASCSGPAAKEWRPGWRNEAQYGGGGLYDWGSHLIDQLWRLMLPARPTLVYAQLRGNVWSTDCDDFARVCIDFDNGAAGLIEINTTTTRPLPRWHIDGTTGSADSPFSLEFDVNIWSTLTFYPGEGSAPRHLQRVENGLSESQIWTQFGRAIRGEGPPAVTAASVLPTLAILDAARESGRTGRAVDISREIPAAAQPHEQ